MLLIEPDKRGPDWAVKLVYAEKAEERFYVPSNVFILGMMNTADRSLAVVDYALRRGFAFATIHPAFGEGHIARTSLPVALRRSLLPANRENDGTQRRYRRRYHEPRPGLLHRPQLLHAGRR